MMHNLDVSHTFQNPSHLNPFRRCRKPLPYDPGESICRRWGMAWVDAWLLMPSHHDEEEGPDEDDKGGGPGESRCRSLVVAWVDALPDKRCNGKVAKGVELQCERCNV